jgi:uncharacterized protein (UPF0332 family)/predicted nucleotidyltransferase
MTQDKMIVLDDIKTSLAAAYGERMRGVYLFGSYSRDEADAESDFDVLLVLDAIPSYAEEINRTGEVVARLSLKYGVSISRHLVAESDWSARRTSFFEAHRAGGHRRVTEETAAFLVKAARAIHAANVPLREEEHEFAAGRAYYAMLYTAEALLAGRDLHYRKHGGVHGAFGEHFAKTGLLDPKYHRWMLDAFDKRAEGDYGMNITLSTSDVREMIAQAEEFLAAARNLVDSNPLR